MSDTHYDAETFDEPLRALPLGHIDHASEGDLLTLGDYVGGEIRGRYLAPDQVNALKRVDPTVNLQDRPADERALLWWLANEGMVALVAEKSPEAVLELVAVLRKRLEVVAELEDGFRIQLDDGPITFEISDLGARLIPHIDGRRSLGEIAELVAVETVSDPENRLLVQEAEEAEGKPFAQFLAEAALDVVAVMWRVGALTVDRKTP